MLAAIASALGGSLIDALLGNVRGIFEAYFKKEITEKEMRFKLQEALLKTFAEVEVAHADALAKTYSAFMKAASTNLLMQIMWAVALGTQIFVLFWYQWVVPFIVFMEWASRYPSAGSTVEWAYALIAGLLGMGPVVLRNGPGAGNMTDRLKAMVGK